MAGTDVHYAVEPILSVVEFLAVLEASGLAQRRPVDDRPRLEAMLRNASLIVTARTGDANRLVGVARSVTDFAYCCYLSDLAVDRAHQGRGIGRQLLARTREAVSGFGPTTCLLLSAPAAIEFYRHAGLAAHPRCFEFTGFRVPEGPETAQPPRS